METNYFVVKCFSMEHLKKCVKSEIWAYRHRVNPPQPHEILNEAHKRGRVILIFSVNNQHGWHGICESKYSMIDESKVSVEDLGRSDGTGQLDDGWHRFPVKWIKHFQDISTYACLSLEMTKHFTLIDGSSANQARNWQQMSPEAGQELCELLHKHYDELLEKKVLSEKEKQSPKEESFFKAEEESITSSEQIVGGWTSIIEKVEKDLGRVILACPFGSQRYNCSLPDSDNDVFIVYQAKTIDILGLDPPKQTIKNSESEKIDYTVLEMQRYCELLISCDPKCLETLFIDEESILAVASGEWQQLRKLRNGLLTRTCVDKYLREAQGSRGIKQLEKLHIQGKECTSTKINKLGYIILRLLQSACEIVKEKSLMVYRPTDSVQQREILSARRGDLDFSALMTLINGYLENINRDIQSCQDLTSDAKSDVQQWLINCRLKDLQENAIFHI